MRVKNRIKEILKKGESHLVLFKGFNEENKNPFHAFILLDGYNLNRLEDCRASVILGEYGEVLYSYDGHDVSDGTCEAVISGVKARLRISQTDT